jgi:peroxiredoxin
MLDLGSEVPDETFTTDDGRSVLLSSLRGRTVLLNFWAFS